MVYPLHIYHGLVCTWRPLVRNNSDILEVSFTFSSFWSMLHCHHLRGDHKVLNAVFSLSQSVAHPFIPKHRLQCNGASTKTPQDCYWSIDWWRILRFCWKLSNWSLEGSMNHRHFLNPFNLLYIYFIIFKTKLDQLFMVYGIPTLKHFYRVKTCFLRKKILFELFV